VILPPLGLTDCAREDHLAAAARPADRERCSPDPEAAPGRDIVAGRSKAGGAAIFAAFGLGKTLMQLEIMRQIGCSSAGAS
jgi:hypothetical protein